MLKKSLFVVAALALLASVATAGESKHDYFPIKKEWVPQEACPIKVVMDIGYWVSCEPQKIKIEQDKIHEYSGCKDIEIDNNFALTLTAKIAATGKVPGKYSVKLNGGGSADIPKGGGSVNVCVYLKEADLGNVAEVEGGDEDVHVATVTLMVVPQAAP
jgi:hypothetical protein